MFEKLLIWIRKKDKEKFRVWALKQAIAILLPQWHLSKNPVRKQKEKEEKINDEQERISNI